MKESVSVEIVIRIDGQCDPGLQHSPEFWILLMKQVDQFIWSVPRDEFEIRKSSFEISEVEP